MAETKKCEGCEAVIAKDEKICPACKLDLEALDANIEQLDQIEKIRAKRNAAKTPTKTATVELKKKGLFGGLVK